jgi:predicted nucleic acid-binding protein
MVSFDTNILVYATTSGADAKAQRARDLIARSMQAGSTLLLLQSLTEFSSVAIRKAQIPPDAVGAMIAAWQAVLPVRAAEEPDLAAALKAVKAHQLSFWDAMLWATAQRVGVRHLLTEDMQDGFVLQGVRFTNPFASANDRLIDEILPATAKTT